MGPWTLVLEVLLVKEMDAVTRAMGWGRGEGLRSSPTRTDLDALPWGRGPRKEEGRA